MLCRIVLGSVFVLSGVPKILYPWVFARAVEAYQLAPAAVVTLVAVMLPWVEVVAGLALLSGVARRGAAAVLGLLSMGFAVAVTFALARGLEIECGCFSWFPSSVGVGHVVFDLALAGCAWIVFSWRVPAERENFQAN